MTMSKNKKGKKSREQLKNKEIYYIYILPNKLRCKILPFKQILFLLKVSRTSL